MDGARIELLLKRYLDQVITEPELLELSDLLREGQNREQTVVALDGLIHNSVPARDYEPERWEPVFERVLQASAPLPARTAGKVMKIGWWRWAAAAVILVLLGYGVWRVSLPDDSTNEPIAKGIPMTPILPGKEGAILTLANGSQVLLDSLGSGVLLNEDGSRVALQDGALSYEGNSEKGTSADLMFHTMTTPKGRQFTLVLPDGTRAWLNAASSIRYPVRFSTRERRIEITGEVYLEVAKMDKLPFRVHVNRQAEIVVLGTHFNINAYEEQDGIQTTLLEGSVRVRASGRKREEVVIRPGQQALVKESLTVEDNVDLEQVMAWKNGLFNFEDASLREVMGQLTRWYDIEVVYPKGIPDVAFGGKMSRNVPLADVLKGLKGFGISYRLEERRKLVVMP